MFREIIYLNIIELMPVRVCNEVQMFESVLVFLKAVSDNIQIKARHVCNINTDLEYFRTSVDHDPVQVNGTKEIFPVGKLARSVRSCDGIDDAVKRIRGEYSNCLD